MASKRKWYIPAHRPKSSQTSGTQLTLWWSEEPGWTLGVPPRTELGFAFVFATKWGFFGSSGWLKLPQAAYFPLFSSSVQSKAYGRHKALGSTKLLGRLRGWFILNAMWRWERWIQIDEYVWFAYNMCVAINKLKLTGKMVWSHIYKKGFKSEKYWERL